MLDNCFRFAPRDSIPGLISKICKYLKEHPGWSVGELEEQIRKFISETGVESFNGRTGVVTLDKNDVNNLKIAPAYFADGNESIDSLDLVSLYNQGVRFVFTDFNSVTSGYNLAFVLEYFSGSGNVVYYPMSTGSGGGGNIVSVNGKTGVVELSLADIIGSSGVQVKICTEGEFTSTTTERWNAYYDEGYRIVCVVNSSVTSIDHIYVLKQDKNNHTPIGLSTGASNAYTPDNPPPYPVNDVNTKTGSVTLKVVDVSNGNSSDKNAYIFIDEGEDYGDVIASDSAKLGGELPSYYASAEGLRNLKASDIGYGGGNVGTALDALDKSVSSVTNKTQTPYAAGKVWTSFASGAGWADAIGGTQIELLWENVSPGTEMAADADGVDSIQIDWTGYTLALIIYNFGVSANNQIRKLSHVLPVVAGTYAFLNVASAGYDILITRELMITEGGLHVSGASRCSKGTITSDVNTYIIPYAIYGIKGVTSNG